MPDEEVFTIDIEFQWELYFDGASRTEIDPDGEAKRQANAGFVFKTLQWGTVHHSFSLLKEECSNNEAEYEALLFGLLLSLSMDVRNILLYGDSQLIVRQVNNIYEVRKPELVPYHTAAQVFMRKFEHIQIWHVPRSKNASADALAKLASLPQGKPAEVQIEERWLLLAVLELIPPT